MRPFTTPGMAQGMSSRALTTPRPRKDSWSSRAMAMAITMTSRTAMKVKYSEIHKAFQNSGLARMVA